MSFASTAAQSSSGEGAGTATRLEGSASASTANVLCALGNRQERGGESGFCGSGATLGGVVERRGRVAL